MKATSNKVLKQAILSAALLSAAPLAFAGNAAPLDGRWDAQLIDHGYVVPFRLDISGEGNTLQGTFYDGFRPYDHTTAARFKDGRLTLDIGHYSTTIDAELKDGKLVGKVGGGIRGYSYDYQFLATRHDDKSDAPVAGANVPNIAGTWDVPLPEPSSKGEKAFSLIVEQRGAEVAATILRVDGDTGAQNGVYKDGHWVLSHYDGSRPSVITLTPQADGSLRIDQNYDFLISLQRQQKSENGNYEVGNGNDGRYARTLTAYRPDVAKAKGLAQPDDHFAHTTARDPHEKFAFAFKDLDGKLLTQDDPEFKGKPILAIVTGTWCPNCHDEAQYLVQLDKKYHDQGLRIVALDFEEVEQQASEQRARAFVKQYGVKYPYLVAGAPEEMWEKVPQLNNLNTWPATVFIGRDGTIRAVHSGFGSPATGAFYTEQDKEFNGLVQKLLAEPAPVADVVAPTESVAVR